MSSEPADGVIPSYRRNGKLFSCEPCRRGKLRCDHNTPTCGRCARRNKPDQCVYHPAPLTKPRSSPEAHRRSSAASSRHSTTISRPVSRDGGAPNGSGLASPPSSSRLTKEFSAFRPVNGASLGLTSMIQQSPQVGPMGPTPISGEDRQTSSSASFASPESMSFRDSKTGFLGPTSYSAVFTENPQSLSVITEPHDSGDSQSLPPVSAEKIQQGAEVLAMLRDMYANRWAHISAFHAAVV